jgi:uncharacterized protein
VTPPEPSLAALLTAAAVAALVVGFLKTSLGGGIGLVLTPTLSIVLPPSVVLALTAPLMALSDPVTLRYYWRRWDTPQLRLLLPANLVGVVLGTWALSILSEAALRTSIAVVALSLAALQVALMIRQRPLREGPPHRTAAAAAGVVTGVASSVAHSGGIVLGLYLAGLRLSSAAVVGTITAVFAASNLLKLAGYWQIGILTPRLLVTALIAAPLVLVGTRLGYGVNRRLPRRWFEVALVTIAVAGSLRLLLGR